MSARKVRVLEIITYQPEQARETDEHLEAAFLTLPVGTDQFNIEQVEFAVTAQSGPLDGSFVCFRELAPAKELSPADLKLLHGAATDPDGPLQATRPPEGWLRWITRVLVATNDEAPGENTVDASPVLNLLCEAMDPFGEFTVPTWRVLPNDDSSDLTEVATDESGKLLVILCRASDEARILEGLRSPDFFRAEVRWHRARHIAITYDERGGMREQMQDCVNKLASFVHGLAGRSETESLRQDRKRQFAASDAHTDMLILEAVVRIMRDELKSALACFDHLQSAHSGLRRIAHARREMIASQVDQVDGDLGAKQPIVASARNVLQQRQAQSAERINRGLAVLQVVLVVAAVWPTAVQVLVDRATGWPDSWTNTLVVFSLMGVPVGLVMLVVYLLANYWRRR
jgi:hypothetical protein